MRLYLPIFIEFGLSLLNFSKGPKEMKMNYIRIQEESGNKPKVKTVKSFLLMMNFFKIN